MVGKYIGIAKMQLQESLTYRFNFFTTAFFILAPLISHLCIWQAVYGLGNNSTTMAGYTFEMMMTYTILGHFTDKFTNEVLTQLKISTEIRNGLISRYLIKPINSFFVELSILLSNNVVCVLTFTIPYVVLTFFYRDAFIVNLDPIKLFVCFINVLIGIVLGFMINHLVGIITFWLKEITALYVFTQSTFLFLSGGYVALDLLPKPIFDFLMMTPFPYLLFFPVNIYVKNYSAAEIIGHMGISITWVVVLFFVNKIIWEMGLKRYTADGI